MTAIEGNKAMKQHALALATFSIMASSHSVAHAVTFTDADFANSDWTAQQLILTGSQPSDPTATFSAIQVGSGGSSGPYRQVTHTYQGPVQAIAVGHLQNNAVFSLNGAQIDKVTVSFDLNFFNYPGTQPGASYAVGYSALAYQGGRFYLGPVDVTVSPTWASFTRTLTASDFRLLNGIEAPDFSAGAGPVQFGFASLNGTASGARTTTISGIDNWQVSLATTPVASVPEPGQWAMLIAGLGLVGGAVRHRRKSESQTLATA